MSGTGGGAEPPQTGLADMGNISFYNQPTDPIPPFTLSDLANYAGSFGEIVLNVTWAQLQPNANGSLDTSVISSAISAVETYNAENGTDLGIKLRVWGGYTAPDWAKTIDGPPITITGPGTVDQSDKNNPETIGRFWTADYIDAWTSLQNQLAALYDGNPIISGISNTAGAAATDEPFVPLKYIPPNQAGAVNQPGELESGGYTDAAEQLTLRAAIADYSGWATTPLDYTMNLFHLQDSGKPSGDENFTLAVLQEAENSARVVQAGNHALNNPLPSFDAFVYAQMAEDAALDPTTAPGSFQTASPVNLGTNESVGSEPSWGAYADWPNAVTQGVAANAGDIELWDGPATTGFTGLEPGQVQDLAAILAAGTAPLTGAPDDGAALGFMAPASVAGAAGTIAFSGVDAVLLASAVAQNSYTVTLTSTGGDTLAVTNFGGIVDGPASGAALTVSGPLSLVNTVLASLTDTLQSGTDVVQFSATDSSGDTAVRSVGVQVSAPAASSGSGPGAGVPPAVPAGSTSYTWTGQGSDTLFSDPANWTPANGPPGAADSVSFTTAASPAPSVVTGTGAAASLTIDSTVAFGGGSTITVGQNGAGDLDIADQQGSAGVLVLGGVESSLAVAGNLEIGGTESGAGGSGTLLAALAPSDYSTASLTVGGTLEVWGAGIARFTGSLEAAAVTIENRGTISGDGTLTATGGAILNDGTIEAATDQTLGLQQLTVANALAGEGALVIDPAASLILGGAVGPHQTIDFAPAGIAQFSDDPYSPSTLVLAKPLGMQGSVSGFSFADTLVLDGVTATGASYDGTNGTLTVDQSGGGPLSFALSGDLAGLAPVVNVAGSGAGAESTVSFVAPAAGLLPSVTAPAALEGAAGAPVLVPDIVIAAPLPASPPSDMTIGVTLAAVTGTLAAGDDNGNTSVNYSVGGGSTLTLSGTLGAVERSLQTLTYTGAAGQPKDTITITVSDYAGASATAATISVFNNSAPLQFDWTSSGGGSFADAGNWTAGGTTSNVAPGGTNIAAFGPGTNTISGNGAVGEILDTGTTTLTGQVTAQARNGVALVVDAGGALTLAGGASLTAQGQASVGGSGQGLLTLMGGALALTGPSTSNALVIGAAGGSGGTVLNLEQIEAAGTVVVGEAGAGTLELLGVAATAADGGADMGQSAGAQGIATIDGGEWATSGQLTVGDAGNGSLLIGGTVNGITGQVTAFDMTIGAQAGGQGSVTLDGGDLLVADADAASSALTVGAGGTGSLTIADGGNVTVGVAQGTIANNTGTLEVGGTAGGSGLVRIGGDGALLVDGNATIGGAAGAGAVTVGQSADDTALFATAGTLAIDGTGQIALGGANASVRANVLDLAPGALLSGAGTLSGDGGGNDTMMLASIENDGSIAASGGNLLLYGDVAGTGALSVATGATITLQAAVDTGQTLALSPNAQAVLDDPRAFAGTIAGFGSGDVLDLASTDASSATWSNGVLTLDTASGAIQLNLAGTYASNAFAVQPDGLGGTDVVLAPNGGGEGDVHMLTFDGLHYDFQAVGEFVAARSTEPGNPFQVQIQTQSGNGAVSTTEQLAAALGDARVTFAVGRADPVWINGAPDKALRGGAVQRLAGGTLAQLSSGSYQLTWNTGESVSITDAGAYLDWSVSLGPHDGPGSVQGLLGSDSGQANDFQLPNGSVIPQPLSGTELLGAFADAWQVAPGTSLLDNTSAPSPTTEPAVRTALAGMIAERPHFIHTAGVDAAETRPPTAASPVSYEAGTAVQDAVAQSAGEFFGLAAPDSPTAAFADAGANAAASAHAAITMNDVGSALPFGASSLVHTSHGAVSW